MSERFTVHCDSGRSIGYDRRREHSIICIWKGRVRAASYEAAKAMPCPSCGGRVQVTPKRAKARVS